MSIHDGQYPQRPGARVFLGLGLAQLALTCRRHECPSCWIVVGQLMSHSATPSPNPFPNILCNADEKSKFLRENVKGSHKWETESLEHRAHDLTEP
jgi:hypothetical protein